MEQIYKTNIEEQESIIRIDYYEKRITVYTQSIAYIQLEKEEQVKRYSIKQFQKIRKDILELLISQK